MSRIRYNKDIATINVARMVVSYGVRSLGKQTRMAQLKLKQFALHL